jgi:hypothetical protein
MTNAVPEFYVIAKQENSDQGGTDLFVFATEIVCL